MTAPAYVIGVPYLSLPISRVLTKLGRGERYAAGQHDYNGGDRQFLNNPLSHDRERFDVIEKYFDANPDLKVGGVTWGWLAATLQYRWRRRAALAARRRFVPSLHARSFAHRAVACGMMQCGKPFYADSVPLRRSSAQPAARLRSGAGRTRATLCNTAVLLFRPWLPRGNPS